MKSSSLLLLLFLSACSMPAGYAKEDLRFASAFDPPPLGVAGASDTVTCYGDPVSTAPAVLLVRKTIQFGKNLEYYLKPSARTPGSGEWQSGKALLAAGAQNKFWEMNDLLSQKVPVSDAAAQLQLDMELFNKDLARPQLDETISRNNAYLEKRGVNSGSACFFDGKGPVEPAKLIALLNQKAAKAQKPKKQR